VHSDTFTLDHWGALAADGREAAVRILAAALPAPFAFAGIHAHALGEQRHQVALFDCAGSAFALIPGGEITLGYDRERPFVPTERQRASWRATQEEYGCGELEEYLEYYLTPLRAVSLAPFLLEVDAVEQGLTPISVDLALSGGVRGQRGGTLYSGIPVAHRDVVALLAGDGFRLPTSDEWEHACAAGARTLFRWGDDCPADHYPSGDADALHFDFDLHRRPNAFGLRIGLDPYDWELVAEPSVMRGGDGGGVISAGAGYMAGWLTLATAFVDPEYHERPGYGTAIRRAYTLPE